MPIALVGGIDHIVLRVKDPIRSVQWYNHTLGLEPVRVEEFKAGEQTRYPRPAYVCIVRTYIVIHDSKSSCSDMLQ